MVEVRYSSFFFQAEDGIRDLTVTGVQTCALPISEGHVLLWDVSRRVLRLHGLLRADARQDPIRSVAFSQDGSWVRSEEHTSELQSQSNLVCRLLLEKKKKKT